ncbi:MAG: bifunctional riboflavin kinase/FAD synthetase [Pseudomonadota bacterium]
MQVIRGIENIRSPLPGAVVTIGNFDGVHLGHQEIFRRVIERARDIGGTAVVFTFEPHPIRVVRPQAGPPLITVYDQKVELIERCGIDVLVCADFTPEFALTSAREFISGLLVERLGMKEIMVGYDWAFGRNREGNISLLMELGALLGFQACVLGPYAAKGMPISSTRVRQLVQLGDIVTAARLLGRPYQVKGQVIRGRARGGNLVGFPTANLKLVDELWPKKGVYAVMVEWAGRTLQGVANIGHNPTFGENELSVETHILDFSDDIYGQTIRLDFIARLRDEKRFSGPHELHDQIAADITLARSILTQPGS